MIQDLIDNGEVSIDQQLGNQELGIHKTPMPNHNKGNDKRKGKGYHQVSHVYNNVVGACDHHIFIITIKGHAIECGVTT